MRRIVTIVAPWLAVVANQVALPDQASCGQEQGFVPVPILYFREEGCPDCQYIAASVLPALKAQYEGFYALREFDTASETNHADMAGWRERLGKPSGEPVCMVVAGRFLLNGTNEIRARLFAALDRCVSEGIADAEESDPRAPPADGRRRSAWPILAVLVAAAAGGVVLLRRLLRRGRR